MTKLILVFALMLYGIWGAAAQTAGEVSGRVLDASGAAVPGAEVRLTNTATHARVQASTDSNGTFDIKDLAPGTYTLEVIKAEFVTFRQENLQIQAGQALSVNASMTVRPVAQAVEVRGELPGVTAQPTQEEVFTSDETIRVIDRKQMDAAGPLAGSAQVIAMTPGANVTGYGNTGATKYTVTLNGIGQGWGANGGYSGGAARGITYDGIPIVDPATYLWQSPTLPQTDLIQNVDVVYGPGDPANRWYSNIGGSLEFTPLQPSAKAHADVWMTYGSYNQKNMAFDLASGVYDGWSAILAAGGGLGDDFRTGLDGFNNPSKDYAVAPKVLKTFGDNSFDLGGYFAHSGGYRAQVIPAAPNPLITTNGQPGGVVYSQQTSGFYSSLPFDSYNKYDTNEMGLIYGREDIKVDDTTRLQNETWFMHIGRLHNRLADVYNQGPQVFEWNNPHTDTMGDGLQATKKVAANTFTVGGYYIHALYNSRNNFYNPADGGSFDTVNIGGQLRSSYFSQDDFALSFQDDFHPWSKLHITPGIRYVGFGVNYSQGVLQDFNFAPGVVLSQHCPATNFAAPGNTKDQSASCDNHQNRSGIEPSITASLYPLPWLTLYGGFLEALRAPSMGGGGGLFQSVNPYSYHLARQRYRQAGFKIHSEGSGPLHTMIFGAAYYHENYANQEIDNPLANGNVISANGSSVYHGVNVFFDDDPVSSVHLFANMNYEGATYSNYEVGSLSYAGSNVPYVPASTFNSGAYYTFKLFHRYTVQSMGAFQFTGTQHIFDNTVGAPSQQTMPAFETVNVSMTVPFKHFDLTFAGMNLLNKGYNIYEFISSGGYFGTPTGGYILAYPGAPFTAYGGVNLHF